MHNFTPRKHTWFLLAIVLIGLSCTWAIASSSTAPVPAATPEIAFEDLPEFAPKFQHIVARKRAVRHFALDRISCSWSGARFCAHSAGL
jgi:hypothetical protein